MSNATINNKRPRTIRDLRRATAGRNTEDEQQQVPESPSANYTKHRQLVDSLVLPPWLSMEGRLEFEADGSIAATRANFETLYPKCLTEDPTGLIELHLGPGNVNENAIKLKMPELIQYLRPADQVPADLQRPTRSRPKAYDFECNSQGPMQTTANDLARGPSFGDAVKCRVTIPIDILPVFSTVLNYLPDFDPAVKHPVLDKWVQVAVEAMSPNPAAPLDPQFEVVFDNAWCHTKLTESWVRRTELFDHYTEWKATTSAANVSRAPGLEDAASRANDSERAMRLYPVSSALRHYLITVNPNVVEGKPWEDFLASASLHLNTTGEELEKYIASYIQVIASGQYEFKGRLAHAHDQNSIKSVAMVATSMEVGEEDRKCHFHFGLAMSHWSIGECYVHVVYDVIRSRIRDAMREWGFPEEAIRKVYVNVSSQSKEEAKIAQYVRKSPAH